VLFQSRAGDLIIVAEEFMNTFSLSSWILQSITLFLAILAAIPLIRAILGLTLVAISETLNLKSPALRKAGIKLMPAFLRASLGIGLAIGIANPAMAETLESQIPVIDRVIDFETNAEAPIEQVVETESIEDVQVSVFKPADKKPAKNYVIKSGDSLWSIAQDEILGEGASINEIDSTWRKIWRANREVIGNNPSLIRPGQEINLDVFAK
jgi:LysM repeat protein